MPSPKLISIKIQAGTHQKIKTISAWRGETIPETIDRLLNTALVAELAQLCLELPGQEIKPPKKRPKRS